MKKIGVVTATRAEYGVLKNILKLLSVDSELELCLLVTGTHLSNEFGMTVEEIENDGFQISREIPILSERGGHIGIAMTMGNASVRFARAFEELNIDMLIVVGDRYELLPIVATAVNYNIPVAHICGGETTEGAIDECIRHSITKMSYLHFPACEEYRRRIIQMGEDPDRVFNVGDIGVESIKKIQLLNKEKLSESIGFNLFKPYFCVTFHPVTQELDMVEKHLNELLSALDYYKDEFLFVISKSNADVGADIINTIFEQYVKERDNCVLYKSLGSTRYLSLMKHSIGVIGNSSSGIIEAPSLGIPTINIGNRQRGRLQAGSIVNAEPDKNDIIKAINSVLTDEFKKKVSNVLCPYDGHNSSEQIVYYIKEAFDKGINLEKKFYDVSYMIDEKPSNYSS